MLSYNPAIHPVIVPVSHSCSTICNTASCEMVNNILEIVIITFMICMIITFICNFFN